MDLESLLQWAHQQGASDLHLEPTLPPAVRLRGVLRASGEPLPAKTLMAWAKNLLHPAEWSEFEAKRSFDMSQTLAGIRCRVNVLQTSKGTGFAIRLLSGSEPTIERLNLHPQLKELTARSHGLILVSGPTGCGKSSTLAALLQEINLSETRHIVTIESPIEYMFRSRKSFIRQREVGRDTPSFEQALLDALREDPDVLMVGEMRDPETMRLTLNASETGHLVLATVHSSTAIEALQRIVAAFPSEIQSSVGAQLADCLAGVIAQRLQYRPELQIRVPECEILLPTNPVKAHIRSREFFKIQSVLETGAESGMWTFHRYRAWLEKRTQWHIPDPRASEASPSEEAMEPLEHAPLPLPSAKTTPKPSFKATEPPPKSPDGRIEIEPVESPFGKILKH